MLFQFPQTLILLPYSPHPTPQMPLPFLPPPPPLGPLFLLGSAVLFAGLMAFNAPLWLPAAGRRLRAQLAVR